MNAQERQQVLADYLMRRPGVALCIPDVAAALGRSPGRAFNNDLAVARGFARQVGCIITNCSWNRRTQQYEFYFLLEGDERELSGAGLRTAVKHARSRVRNVAKQAEYTAKNAPRAEDRADALLTIRWAKISDELWNARDEYVSVLASDRMREQV